MEQATQYLLLMTVATPIIVAVVQLLKGLGCPVKYAPVAAILVGIVTSLAIGMSSSSPVVDANAADFLLAGVLGGLGASGLYSGVDTIKNR